MFVNVKKLKNYVQIITFSVVVLLCFAPNITVHAQTSALKDSYDQVCGNKFKNDPKYQQFYKNLSDAQQYDLNNPQIENSGTKNSDLLQAGCPPSLDDITFIVLRVITIMLTIVGAVAFFNLIKAGFMLTTAGANKDKVKAARGSIQGTIAGIMLIMVGYTVIVFIASRLGLSNDPNNFSILDGGNLIFKFLFDY